jgi:hypothetical protein
MGAPTRPAGFPPTLAERFGQIPARLSLGASLGEGPAHLAGESDDGYHGEQACCRRALRCWAPNVPITTASGDGLCSTGQRFGLSFSSESWMRSWW